MLNQALDWDDIRAQYARDRRVTIRDFLEPDIAESLSNCLQHQVTWTTVYRGADGLRSYSADQLAAITPENLQRINQAVAFGAQNKSPYYYHRYDIQLGESRNLTQLVDFMTSKPCLDVLRRVTAEDDIVTLSAMANLYGPSCYLKLHNDIQQNVDRKAAYILGFTKDWRPDWGGMLHILNQEKTQVVDCYIPSFNCLTLLAVPTWHFVSQVAHFAKKGRYSITGWLMGSGKE